MPNPRDMPTVRRIGPTPTMGELNQQIQSMFEMLIEAENRDKEQMRLLGNLAAQHDSLVERVDKLRSRVDAITQDAERTKRNLVQRIMTLEEGGAPVPAPPSPMAIVRELVLAFFQTHRGIKMSPEVVRTNIADQIPEGAIHTAVANACRDLSVAGKLQGGGTNSKGKAGPSGTRGIYWLDVEETK